MSRGKLYVGLHDPPSATARKLADPKLEEVHEVTSATKPSWLKGVPTLLVPDGDQYVNVFAGSRCLEYLRKRQLSPIRTDSPSSAPSKAAPPIVVVHEIPLPPLPPSIFPFGLLPKMTAIRQPLPTKPAPLKIEDITDKPEATLSPLTAEATSSTDHTTDTKKTSGGPIQDLGIQVVD